MLSDGEQESRKWRAGVTRYLTYLGLCIATCIICQKNVVLASIIGLLVAAYISVSEYVMNKQPLPTGIDLSQ